MNSEAVAAIGILLVVTLPILVAAVVAAVDAARVTRQYKQTPFDYYVNRGE